MCRLVADHALERQLPCSILGLVDRAGSPAPWGYNDPSYTLTVHCFDLDI